MAKQAAQEPGPQGSNKSKWVMALEKFPTFGFI